MKERVAIAADHAGILPKAELSEALRAWGYDVVDLGPDSTTPTDYPDYAHALARKVVSGEVVWGVLICGSGIGMSIAANKVPGARAALVGDPLCAKLARNHNDANIIVFGARMLGPDMMRECLRVFAESSFTPGDDGRHARRVGKLEIV